MILNGKNKNAITKQLMKKGIPQEEAEAMVNGFYDSAMELLRENRIYSYNGVLYQKVWNGIQIYGDKNDIIQLFL